jgi:hypothetical protein
MLLNVFFRRIIFFKLVTLASFHFFMPTSILKRFYLMFWQNLLDRGERKAIVVLPLTEQGSADRSRIFGWSLTSTMMEAVDRTSGNG